MATRKPPPALPLPGATRGFLLGFGAGLFRAVRHGAPPPPPGRLASSLASRQAPHLNHPHPLAPPPPPQPTTTTATTTTATTTITTPTFHPLQAVMSRARSLRVTGAVLLTLGGVTCLQPTRALSNEQSSPPLLDLRSRRDPGRPLEQTSSAVAQTLHGFSGRDDINTVIFRK